MKATNFLLGLAPWILFSLIANHLGPGEVGLAALLACLGSLALTIRGARADGTKLLDVAGVVTFGAMAALGFAGGHEVREGLVDFGRAGCALVLAGVMLVSALTVPFTEQYARSHVDRRYWGSPVFRATNRRISLLWAGLIALMAVSHLVAGALAATGESRPVLMLALNWGVPVLVLLRGVKATERIAAEGRSPAVVGGAA